MIPSTDPRPTQRLRESLRLGGRCPRCDYDLRKHTGVQCPECGFVLAAELLHDRELFRVRYGIWVHRALGAVAIVAVLVVAARCIIATVNSTPHPSLMAFLYLGISLTTWGLHELISSFAAEIRRARWLSVLLAAISLSCLYAAWRWS